MLELALGGIGSVSYLTGFAGTVNRELNTQIGMKARKFAHHVNFIFQNQAVI